MAITTQASTEEDTFSHDPDGESYPRDPEEGEEESGEEESGETADFLTSEPTTATRSSFVSRTATTDSALGSEEQPRRRFARIAAPWRVLFPRSARRTLSVAAAAATLLAAAFACLALTSLHDEAAMLQDRLRFATELAALGATRDAFAAAELATTATAASLGSPAWATALQQHSQVLEAKALALATAGNALSSAAPAPTAATEREARWWGTAKTVAAAAGHTVDPSAALLPADFPQRAAAAAARLRATAVFHGAPSTATAAATERASFAFPAASAFSTFATACGAAALGNLSAVNRTAAASADFAATAEATAAASRCTELACATGFLWAGVLNASGAAAMLLEVEPAFIASTYPASAAAASQRGPYAATYAALIPAAAAVTTVGATALPPSWAQRTAAAAALLQTAAHDTAAAAAVMEALVAGHPAPTAEAAAAKDAVRAVASSVAAVAAAVGVVVPPAPATTTQSPRAAMLWLDLEARRGRALALNRTAYAAAHREGLLPAPAPAAIASWVRRRSQAGDAIPAARRLAWLSQEEVRPAVATLAAIARAAAASTAAADSDDGSVDPKRRVLIGVCCALCAAVIALAAYAQGGVAVRVSRSHVPYGGFAGALWALLLVFFAAPMAWSCIVADHQLRRAGPRELPARSMASPATAARLATLDSAAELRDAAVAAMQRGEAARVPASLVAGNAALDEFATDFLSPLSAALAQRTLPDTLLGAAAAGALRGEDPALQHEPFIPDPAALLRRGATESEALCAAFGATAAATLGQLAASTTTTAVLQGLAGAASALRTRCAGGSSFVTANFSAATLRGAVLDAAAAVAAPGPSGTLPAFFSTAQAARAAAVSSTVAAAAAAADTARATDAASLERQLSPPRRRVVWVTAVAVVIGQVVAAALSGAVFGGRPPTA